MGWRRVIQMMRRVIQMMQLYHNWPVALADRAGFLPAGRLVTFRIRTMETDLQLTGETAVDGARVLNEMWLEDSLPTRFRAVATRCDMCGRFRWAQRIFRQSDRKRVPKGPCLQQRAGAAQRGDLAYERFAESPR
jgi:hypothetical protein